MKNLEVYLSGLFILVGGVIFWQASLLPYYSEYGPGPGLLPVWISGLMIALCVVNIIIALKKGKTDLVEILPKGTGLINLLACVGGYALFMILVPYAGFTISSISMLFILFSRGYKWYWGLVWSIAVTVVMYMMFISILGVPLPVNEFGW